MLLPQKDNHPSQFHFAVPYLGISLRKRAEDENPLYSQFPCFGVHPLPSRFTKPPSI